jgi:hypothetical protein
MAIFQSSCCRKFNPVSKLKQSRRLAATLQTRHYFDSGTNKTDDPWLTR